MNVTVIGCGYVGLTSAACFSTSGSLNVICLETDTHRVAQLCSGICPIREPDLDALIRVGLDSGKLHFTIDEETAIKTAELIVIAVGTPPARDGCPNLSEVKQAVYTIARYITRNVTVILKSTLPPGGTEIVQHWFSTALGSSFDVDVVYCPEFLREGNAVADLKSPDRLVIGSENSRAAQRTAELYRCFQNPEVQIVFTTPRNAEIIKYASNSFLAMKVSFVDELARLCRAVGGDLDEVTLGMGLDSRIGATYLHAGPGYGGSCLPKDIQGFTAYARAVGSPLPLLEQVIRSNDRHQSWISEQVRPFLPNNAVISVWGLTFKKDTDDLRNSPAISLIKILSRTGITHFQLYDPTLNDPCLKQLEDVNYICFDNPADAAMGADVLLITVPWPEIKSVSAKRLVDIMRKCVVFDLCGTYKNAETLPDGMTYWCLTKSNCNENSDLPTIFA